MTSTNTNTMSSSTTLSAAQVNDLFRRPDWCPCRCAITVQQLACGNALYLHAALRHLYLEEGSKTLTRRCCITSLLRRFSRGADRDLTDLTLTAYRPDLFLLRRWFEASHPSLITQWLELDQRLVVLPLPYSDTWSLLFARAIECAPPSADPSWVLWMAHVLSRMHDTHLEEPSLLFRRDLVSQCEPLLAQVRALVSRVEGTDALEFHPELRAAILRRLDRLQNPSLP